MNSFSPTEQTMWRASSEEKVSKLNDDEINAKYTKRETANHN